VKSDIYESGKVIFHFSKVIAKVKEVIFSLLKSENGLLNKTNLIRHGQFIFGGVVCRST
jgi:hypothetical protein